MPGFSRGIVCKTLLVTGISDQGRVAGFRGPLMQRIGISRAFVLIRGRKIVPGFEQYLGQEEVRVSAAGLVGEIRQVPAIPLCGFLVIRTVAAGLRLGMVVLGKLRDNFEAICPVCDVKNSNREFRW